MLGVFSAEGAILVSLQAVRRVLFILDRVVVPLLAFTASECDFYSCACSHLFGTSYFIYPTEKRGIASLFKADGAFTQKSAQKETYPLTGINNIAHLFSVVKLFFKNYLLFSSPRLLFTAQCH